MSLPAKQQQAGLELTDIIYRFLDEYKKKYKLSTQQKKVVKDILSCRTQLLGGYVEQCDHCNEIRVTHHSCKNRHCPRCQFVRSYEWKLKRNAELLPVQYFHCVFTLPHTLHPIIRANSKDTYALLFKAVRETLLTIARDKKHLGAEPTITAVLHTWTQQLLYHPHIHCIVSGGGLSENKQWIPSPKTDFLLPISVLADLFKKKYIALLRQIIEVRNSRHFYKLTQTAYDQNWVIYIKPPFAGPESVLKYLSQYTHRIAISNRRLISMDADRVTFKFKDRADDGKIKTLSVQGIEFLRRFLQHVLPFGFVKIRHCGLLASKKKTKSLQLVREILSAKRIVIVDTKDWKTYLAETFDSDVFLCPFCKKGQFHRTGIRLERVRLERGP